MARAVWLTTSNSIIQSIIHFRFINHSCEPNCLVETILVPVKQTSKTVTVGYCHSQHFFSKLQTFHSFSTIFSPVITNTCSTRYVCDCVHFKGNLVLCQSFSNLISGFLYGLSLSIYIALSVWSPPASGHDPRGGERWGFFNVFMALCDQYHAMSSWVYLFIDFSWNVTQLFALWYLRCKLCGE